MKLINDIPVYSIELQEETDGLIMNSIVDSPAVMHDALFFQSTERKELKFSIKDKEQQIISGVSILADTPIYRIDDDNKPYYIVFQKDTIKELVQRYSKNGYQNLVSFQHDGKNIDGFTLIESYFVDKERGVCPKEFKDVTDGSWITSYKCSDEVWDIVKNSTELNGFSVEVLSGVKPMKDEEHVEQPIEEQQFDEFEELINEFLQLKKNKFKKNVVIDDVEKAMKQNRKIIINSDGTEHKVQVMQIGNDAYGNDIAVVYEDETAQWEKITIKNIKELTITDEEYTNVKYNASWKAIVEDETIGILKTLPTLARDKNSIDWCMDRNAVVMIKYDDETSTAAKGYRTCLISSWGYTTVSGGLGNECIRIYEYNGDTSTGFDDGRWRFLLTRRIKEFKAVDYVSSMLTAPPQYNGEAKRGSGINGSMYDVKRTADFPPKIKI